MRLRRTVVVSVTRSIALALCIVAPVRAQPGITVDLVVPRGRPLRVALTETSTVRQVGQTVTATLIEPVYAHDRIVLPAGTPVTGRITRLDNPSTFTRVRSWISGDFSPHHLVQLEFDSVTVEGRPIAIRTRVSQGIPNIEWKTAADSDDDKQGVVTRAKRTAKQKIAEAFGSARAHVSGAIAAVKEPGRTSRLKQAAIDHAPYRRQTLAKNTAYDAELLAPLAFGEAAETAWAPAGSTPAPDSILHARLATTVDSGTSSRGAPLEAVLTQPVFSDDGRLIYPEGSRLSGEVTFARAARRFHRNGQLRVLFERSEIPGQDSVPLLASLHAVNVSGADRVALDDEGGAAVSDSNARFIQPALALLAMRASLEQGEGRGSFDRTGEIGARTTGASVTAGNVVGRAVGGFIGAGFIGAALSQVWRPLGIGFGLLGVGRTMYSNVLGRGQEIRFAADTPIQVRLAAGPPRRP